MDDLLSKQFMVKLVKIKAQLELPNELTAAQEIIKNAKLFDPQTVRNAFRYCEYITKIN